MNYRNLSLILILLLIFVSCSTVNTAKTLKKGELERGFALGGPVLYQVSELKLYSAIVPNIIFNIAYGITDKITYFGSINAINLFFANMHINTGATFEIIKSTNFIPGLLISPNAHFYWSIRGMAANIYPQIDITSFITYGKYDSRIYFGMINFFDFYSLNDIAFSDMPIKVWRPGLKLGHILEYKNFSFTTEISYLSITVNYKKLNGFVTPLSIGGYGALSVLFSFDWRVQL